MRRYAIFLLLVLLSGLWATPLQTLSRQCKNKEAKACHDLGYLYDQKGKFKKAATLYRRACDLHHAMGCYRLAELYLVGSGVVQSDASFITYTQKACTLGYTQSCSFAQKAQPSKKPPRNPNTPKKTSKSILIREPALGSIKVHARFIDKKKRLFQIDAAMTNRFGAASGWLSFSFPEIRQNVLQRSTFKGFDHIKAYPEGSSIYNIKQKQAMQSRYLLVEGEAKHWTKKRTYQSTVVLKIPPEIGKFTLLVRGTLKRGEKLVSLPQKGTVGQQGFHNYSRIFRLDAIKQPHRPTKTGSTTPMAATPVMSDRPEALLDRRDKLILLDKLLALSYFHRDRKAFEKQLKETLFGGAKYLSYIKAYRCKPRGSSNKSRCTLILAGQASGGGKPVYWEFHAAFTAEKEGGAIKITEMHSLDLLEQ